MQLLQARTWVGLFRHKRTPSSVWNGERLLTTSIVGCALHGSFQSSNQSTVIQPCDVNQLSLISKSLLHHFLSELSITVYLSIKTSNKTQNGKELTLSLKIFRRGTSGVYFLRNSAFTEHYPVFISILPVQSLLFFCQPYLLWTVGKNILGFVIKWDPNSCWIKSKLHVLGTFMTLVLLKLKRSGIGSLQVKPLNPFITQTLIISLFLTKYTQEW